MNNNNVQVGEIAPDFETVAIYDEESYNIRLSDYRKKSMWFFFFIHSILLLFVLRK